MGAAGETRYLFEFRDGRTDLLPGDPRIPIEKDPGPHKSGLQSRLVWELVPKVPDRPNPENAASVATDDNSAKWTSFAARPIMTPRH